MKETSYMKEIGIIIYSLFLSIDIKLEELAILTGLMTIDTVLGVVKSIGLNRTVTFKILFNGFISKLALLLIPVALTLGLKNLDISAVYLVTGSVKVITAGEMISIIANSISIKTKEEVKNFDVVTIFLKSTRRKINSIARGLLN